MLSKFYTYQQAKEFYRNCQVLKLSDPLKDQFDRAILSVVLNLAEGSGKPSVADRKRFYWIAMGSLREVQAILELTGDQVLERQADRLGGCLYRLIQSPGHRPG